MSNAPLMPRATRATEQARLTLAQLSPDAPLNFAFCYACEAAARALEVERVGVWLFVDDRSALRCASLYERSKHEFSSGAILRVADFPNFFASLSIRKAVPAEVAATDPRTAELAEAYLDPLGISSMLGAGLFVDGDLIGVVCHEHVGLPKEWTTEARDFAGSVADLLALRIQSAKVNELKAAFRTQKERLATLQKAQALEQVAGGVAHDFANVLTIIHGKAETLARRVDLPVDARQQARDVVSAAERGHALMRELVEFARPNVHPPTVLDPAEAIAEFLPLLRGAVGNKHVLQYARPPAVGRVLVDKTQLSRVLLNLTLNARDAMPNGGDVQIRLTPVKVAVGQESMGHYALLEVIDEGVGMDEQTRKRAFDPFFTTKAEGTGLGLAVVHRIVDQAGGMARIQSALGKGTTVRVFLPRVGASSGDTIEFVVPPELRG
jgi:two-component system cell cycle sensor histidine kinase/response regulator CckA